jgi:hypothetical protein
MEMAQQASQHYVMALDNNRRTAGNSIFLVVHAKAIQ